MGPETSCTRRRTRSNGAPGTSVSVSLGLLRIGRCLTRLAHGVAELVRPGSVASRVLRFPSKGGFGKRQRGIQGSARLTLRGPDPLGVPLFGEHPSREI